MVSKGNEAVSVEKLTQEKRIESVMIVDDSEPSVFLTRKYLEMSGKCGEIYNAANGEEALESLQKLRSADPPRKPSVILLDINMPRMNGFEFLEEYEKLIEKTELDEVSYILMFTTSDYTEDIKRARKFKSVSKYIVKPLTSENVDEIIDEFGA